MKARISLWRRLWRWINRSQSVKAPVVKGFGNFHGVRPFKGL